MNKIAILHGWAGGNWHVKRFVKTLKENGFEARKRLADVDVIIAHSTGCYRLKENSDAKLILLIGPPYWPSKSVLHRVLKKKSHDTRLRIQQQGFLYTMNKFIWEIIYILIKPGYTFIALKNHRYLHFLDLLENKKIILIRNEDDYLCSPEIEEATKKYKNVRYVSLPGGHDDFMTNPEPYVEIIKKHL